MKKFHLASYNRASNGAIEHLSSELLKKGMLCFSRNSADYVIAVGDRTETFDSVLEFFRENKPIIHLWAGEISNGTHDEVYRHAMTLMSMLQLCTNEHAKTRVEALCKAVDKKPNAYVIGNVMMDDLSVCETDRRNHILVLFNPVSTSREKTREDLGDVLTFIKKQNLEVIWIEPNGDKYSDLITPFVTMHTLPRRDFLGLLKHCRYFVTNSSCQFYEAPFFLKPEQIISIGKRNSERESKYANMKIGGATEKIIEVLGRLK